MLTTVETLWTWWVDIFAPFAWYSGFDQISCIGTFDWATFTFIKKIPLHDAIIIVAVTLITVLTNLAIAVIVGVILASVVFAWQTAKKIQAIPTVNNTGTSKTYLLEGPLFFGSSSRFISLFPFQHDPDDVIIDFKASRVCDHSAIDAIKTVVQRYRSLNKTVHLKHLSRECRTLLGNAGSMVEVNVLEDPQYHVASDELD